MNEWDKERLCAQAALTSQLAPVIEGDPRVTSPIARPDGAGWFPVYFARVFGGSGCHLVWCNVANAGFPIHTIFGGWSVLALYNWQQHQ